MACEHTRQASLLAVVEREEAQEEAEEEEGTLVRVQGDLHDLEE